MPQDKPNHSKRNNALIFIILLAVALGAFWLWIQSEQRVEPASTSNAPPSTEWTTAPEGGVEVDLPEAPMTNVPLKNPVPEADEPDQQETD